MILEPIILGALVGKFINGYFKNLILFLEKVPLILYINLILILLFNLGLNLQINILIEYRFWIVLILRLLLIIILSFNLGKSFFGVTLIGSFLNSLVIVINDGKMPINMDLLEKIDSNAVYYGLKNEIFHNYIIIESKDNISYYLGKIIIFPENYPVLRLISIGDIIIAISIFLIIVTEMKKKNRHINYRKNKKMI